MHPVFLSALCTAIFILDPGPSASIRGSLSAPASDQRSASDSASPQQAERSSPIRIYKERLQPHWLPDNHRFWYRNDLSGGRKEFILVHAERGFRSPAFDHARLAERLSSRSTTGELDPERLPFNVIEFVPGAGVGANAIRFPWNDAVWECRLDTYECVKTDASSLTSTSETIGPARETSRRGRGRAGESAGEGGDSPDGLWTAFIREHNVFIRSRADREEVRLSEDGREGFAYGRLSWSPDSRTLAAFRIEPGDRKEVHLIQSSPPDGGRAKLQSRPYALPGDKFTTYELNLFQVADRKQVRPELDRFEHGWERPRVRWSPDGSRVAYPQVDRGHQRFRVVSVDVRTGEVVNLVDEKSETFIWTAHTENLRIEWVNWLDRSGELIHVSEQDGWRHLYLVDAVKGGIKRQITRGEYVIRAIDWIDEEKRQIWFAASGRNPDQDPYFIHHYRVNFDGTGLVALTEGNGQHTVQYSPDRRYLIDTWSRVDAAPAHELRRAEDGSLVCLLEQADVTELQAGGWEPPEVFVAKGRDGKTDIWGIICRPKDFDPAKKYPVIEDIYAGPQSAYVPKTFSASRRFASLLDLGFVVVKMDGMGTAHRSKAFHDVCWKNLKDAGFPDRILWMQAAAKKYPWMDLARVGVYGTSAGGQNAAGAVLFHPEFYHVAVASCGCHDNRMDKASWNEQWMGYPVGPQYGESSNIDQAHRLDGKLLLIVGEMDDNVPPESTLRFADALIKADKNFDLLVIPGARHGNGGAYGTRRRDEFFARHLLGTEAVSRGRATALRGE